MKEFKAALLTLAKYSLTPALGYVASILCRAAVNSANLRTSPMDHDIKLLSLIEEWGVEIILLLCILSSGGGEIHS